MPMFQNSSKWVENLGMSIFRGVFFPQAPCPPDVQTNKKCPHDLTLVQGNISTKFQPDSSYGVEMHKGQTDRQTGSEFYRYRLL